MDVRAVIEREAKMINRVLRNHGIDAGTRLGWTTVAGQSWVIYGLRTGPAQRIAAVETVMGELNEELTRLRGRRTAARLRRLPLALQVPHPKPAPLAMSPAALEGTGAHEMLIGRSYEFACNDERVALDSSPHTLVAGVTGAGKSVLLQGMLLSLCMATSPAELQIMLVDLKNEDLAACSKLPHIVAHAETASEAERLIGAVYAEKERRINTGRWSGPRLMLWVDEVAEVLREVKGAEERLGSLAALGRSKGINLVVATQRPNHAAVGGLLKANFTTRLVGMVTDAGEAALAAGRPRTGAELLPGRGSFLRLSVGQQEPVLFQSFLFGASDLAVMMRMVRHKWRDVFPGKHAFGVAATGGAGVVEAGARGDAEGAEGDAVQRVLAAVGPDLPRHEAGEVSKAELIRLAYARGALDGPYTGGRNSTLMTAALAAFRAGALQAM